MRALTRSTQGLMRYAWGFGAQHREHIVSAYVERHRLSYRPLVKDITFDAIEEIQQVRLLREPLPLDTFGQTERVNGRIIISINDRIPEMNVKDAEGVAIPTAWHESVHVEREMVPVGKEQGDYQLPLLDIESESPRLIVCKRSNGPAPFDHNEFIAEHAALAAAIAGPDLHRVPAFAELMSVAPSGREIAWPLLYHVAEGVGVNISALVRYFEALNLIRVTSNRVYGNPQLWQSSRTDMLR